MLKNNIYISFFIFVSCFSNQVQKSQENLDFIKIDVSELYKNDNGIKTQLSIMIPTDKLVFQKSIDGFNSEISISAIFVNEDKIIANESWNYKIKKDFFEETKNTKNISINKDIFLPKGEYKLNLIINDYENHILWIKNKQFELYDKFEISDIFLFKKINKEYFPVIDEEVAELDTLWMKLYLEKLNEPIKLNYEFLSIDKNQSSENLIFEENYNTVVQSNNMYFPINIIDDFFNVINIKVNYFNTNRSKSILINRYEKIDYDYSILIGPMDYILENSDFRKLREYDNLLDDQKVQYIIDYWNLGSQDNSLDLFDEFYNRVQYANNNFSFLTYEGWQSDRGKIYIIYGKPFDIKNEFTMEAEYEIWVYKNNKQFVFINKYGNYELSTYN